MTPIHPSSPRPAAALVALIALTASSVFVSCEKQTTVIRGKEEPGIEFKLKTGEVDVEGKIPTENK